jgi:cytochrome c oxidase subunit 2
MSIAIVLVLIALGSILFHVLSPWWFVPLASNWDQMDATLIITLWISAVVFVAIILFTAYAVVKYRYRPERRAAYEPENKKLEWWLIALTSVGIVVMLVPGLYVWAKFVDVPKDAMVVEAVGQQWQWSFRFPGKDAVLGTIEPKLISAQNPFGVKPDDPKGQDDVLVKGGEVHLPLGRPVNILLRAKDVLHDLYVPHFRVKMDAVPGLITRMWLTPTQTGTFEIACAEFCGLGHHTMRGLVVVEPEARFQAWLASQPVFGQAASGPATGTGGPVVERGRALAEAQGCLGCHSVDGSPGIGPTWKGLIGKTETLADGGTVVVDEKYFQQSIAQPNATVVKGYDAIMPPYSLGGDDLNALLAYAKGLSQ